MTKDVIQYKKVVDGETLINVAKLQIQVENLEKKVDAVDKKVDDLGGHFEVRFDALENKLARYSGAIALVVFIINLLFYIYMGK